MSPRKKSSRKKAETVEGSKNLFDTHGDRPRFTGKRIVTMNEDASSSFVKKLATKTSLKIASIKDFDSDRSKYQDAFNQADGIYFDSFKIAVINKGNEEQLQMMENAVADSRDSIMSEPERFVYAFPSSKRKKVEVKKPVAPGVFALTWGVEAIKTSKSKFTGKGVNIAVLDTGLNLSHPDFANVNVLSKSFIRNQGVEDKNGHGTHCCGVAVGAFDKKAKKRYGVASEANLFVGKVLSNGGVGSDSGILAGIEWALQNKCRIISMSLGAEVEPGETFSPAYERAAKTCLKKGCLIVAAAGNESERQFGLIKPVGHPANCPSVMAVAALDSKLKVAFFSCGGINLDGGQVDIAAPGVDIYSSWKSKKHSTISGTSMATPFVAGIGALFCEANPNAKASDIWMMLVQKALRLKLNASDIGAGLLQAR